MEHEIANRHLASAEEGDEPREQANRDKRTAYDLDARRCDQDRRKRIWCARLRNREVDQAAGRAP